jgi:hypothetical protein
LSLKVREGSHHWIIESAAPDDRWNSSDRCWYLGNSDNSWGIVTLEFEELDNDKACVLFTGSSDTYVLDPVEYQYDIAFVTRSSPSISRDDIYNLFRLGEKNRSGTAERRLHVMSRIMGSYKPGQKALEVWTVNSADRTGISENPTHALPDAAMATSFANTDGCMDGRGTASFPQLPPTMKLKDKRPLTTGPDSVAPGPSPKYNPSESIQAVIVPCESEGRGSSRWSATTVPAHHPVFSQTVPLILQLIGIPLVIYRVGTQSANRSDRDDQVATFLNIYDDTGLASPYWQGYVGTVIVARKDRKPLLPQHVESLWEFCSRILD